MQDFKPISTPFPIDVKLSSKMSPSSKKERVEMSRVPYALAVGSLMFAMICTSPDIAYAVGVVSRYMKELGREHLEAVKRIVIYVKGTSDVALCFGDLDLISVVAMSTTEAEYVAAAQASKEAVWLKMLLEELGHEQKKITLFCDNQSALYLARNPACHSKIKHIRVQYHFIYEKVEEGTVDMQKIHTDDKVADYLTKSINYEMDGNSIANLHLALADGVFSSIEEKKNAKEIWDHLARLYEARSLHNKKFLKWKLYALRMTESTSVTEHVNNLNTLFSQLTSLSCKIDSQERAEILLQSLPDSYDQVIINLTNNLLSDYLVFDDVAAAILEEESRRNNLEDKQTSSIQVEALVVTRGRVASTSEDGNALCCEAAVANESRKRFANVWMFDTGATFHMTAKREWFHQYKPISGGGSVYSCNDHEIKIIGIRSIMVKKHDGMVHTIQDVRHEEGLKKNLLSLAQLDDLSCKVEIQNKIMKIIKGALVLMRGEKVAPNLYQLKGEIMEEAEALVALLSPSHRVVVTWHQKLGHMSEQGMKILVERNLLPGLTKVSLPFYEHCVISKHHRLKFKTLNSRSVYVLELVHSNVWQAPVLSLGGAKYFVSFIDDYSRRCWVYPIKKKSDVFEVFKVYKARVELDSGKKIKCLRTDNRGEYTGDEFDIFCRQEGIKGIELKTSMEMWTGYPINYSDLHIFGSPVYVMYNSQETTKVDPKSRKCLFLGYSDGVKGYRLWDPTAHKMEKEFQSNDSSEAVPQHKVNETAESQAPATRTLNRERKRPVWQSDYVMEINVTYYLLTREGESSTLQEALNNPDASFWKEAMQEEIEALHKNKTWELVPLPGGRKPIGNKWMYKIKRNGDDQVERYRARLVVKGYA
ncbi:retrovirus-related pol polyprotein from transposon TNT 1-94 [Tanacetum coccineum]